MPFDPHYRRAGIAIPTRAFSSFKHERHDRILVRDGYGMKLATIHYSIFEHPGKRGAKFPALTKAVARSLALAIVRMGNSSGT